MRRSQGLSGAALTLVVGLIAAGCTPKESPSSEAPTAGPAPAATTTATGASPTAKVQTAVLKAEGMH